MVFSMKSSRAQIPHLPLYLSNYKIILNYFKSSIAIYDMQNVGPDVINSIVEFLKS